MTQPITVSETARKLHSLIERLTEKIISVARAQRDGAASDEFEKGWDSCAESIEHQVRESGENTRLHLALTAALEEIERLKGAREAALEEAALMADAFAKDDGVDPASIFGAGGKEFARQIAAAIRVLKSRDTIYAEMAASALNPTGDDNGAA
jgi:(p)ppGpp synthase/HD superfamily hydrolase